MSKEKDFSTAKQVVAIRPLSQSTKVGFLFTDFSDLKKLVLFVGKKPQIDENGDLFYKKFKITNNSLIIRDSFGNVTEVLELEKAAEHYEVLESHSFSETDINEVQAKVIGERKTRGEVPEGELSRKDLIAYFEANQIKYPGHQTQKVYMELYRKVTKAE